jgi:hypothetical protein
MLLMAFLSHMILFLTWESDNHGRGVRLEHQEAHAGI